MNSRAIFRENGSVIRTRSLYREVLIMALTVLAIVALLAWGHAVDHEGEDRLSFDAGLAVGRQEMAEVVGAAYHRGRLDAAAEQCQAPVAPAVQRQGALL